MKPTDTIEAYADDTTVLWRYMGLPKLLDLLLTNTLVLRRADLFEDAFEGYCPHLTMKTIDGKDMGKDSPAMAYVTRILSYVSCWHANTSESDAMWKVYNQRGEGFAVTTTTSRLVSAYSRFQATNSKNHSSAYSADFGYVKYVADNESRSEASWQAFMFHKRLCFAHEQEARLVVCFRPANVPPGVRTFPEHISMSIEPLDFIDFIVVSPYSSPWVAKTIRALLDRLGYQLLPVTTSTVNRSPNWNGIREEGEKALKDYLDNVDKFPNLFPFVT